MEQDRAAARRRASFARADRLRKEERQKAEQAKTEQRRNGERDKADQERKADARKAAAQREAQARKIAEQRRQERLRETARKQFGRTAEDRHARETQADERRRAEAAKAADRQRQAAERDPYRRSAEKHIRQNEERQLREQQDEHRRQTNRLTAEHRAQHDSFRQREAAAIVHHAQKIRNVDLAERRELEALDASRRSLSGRVVGLVRGAGQFDRQERAIVERHEHERWQQHREHESRKDALFWKEQATRLRQVDERIGMAKSHQAERRELTQAHERNRPQEVRSFATALERVKQMSSERARWQELGGITPVFAQANRNQGLKR